MEWLKHNIMHILILLAVGGAAYLFNQSFAELDLAVGATQSQLSEIKIVVDDNNKRIQDLEKDAESIAEDVDTLKDDLNTLKSRSPL